MKKIILSLLITFTVLSSFTPTPVKEDSKDNWVYELNKPIIKKKVLSCQEGTIAIDEISFNDNCTGTLIAHIVVSATASVPRNYRFKTYWSSGLYVEQTETLPAGWSNVWLVASVSSGCQWSLQGAWIQWYCPQN